MAFTEQSHLVTIVKYTTMRILILNNEDLSLKDMFKLGWNQLY